MSFCEALLPELESCRSVTGLVVCSKILTATSVRDLVCWDGSLLQCPSLCAHSAGHFPPPGLSLGLVLNSAELGAAAREAPRDRAA